MTEQFQLESPLNAQSENPKKRLSSKRTKPSSRMKLRIGDDWNAIRIIALSQSNPLKAIAEFVENSIDARAKNIVITRGRDRGSLYLRIKDDGEGIRHNDNGVPDFEYVATHICDSVKRSLKAHGAKGLQGEFGIGLLSFWTVGEELLLSSSGADNRLYQMTLKKGDPGYRITNRRVIVPDIGTEMTIRGILPGLKQLSGERIQSYLGSELRDRIRESSVQIKVVDRIGRSEFIVEPRRFDGQPLYNALKEIALPEHIQLELYLNAYSTDNRVELHRLGTRVLEDISTIEILHHAPWISGYIQGVIDCGFLELSPGTRSGIIHDKQVEQLSDALKPIEEVLQKIVAEYQHVEDEGATKEAFKSVQKALQEAILSLPSDEYNWFDLHITQTTRGKTDRKATSHQEGGIVVSELTNGNLEESSQEPIQRSFFDHAGPLYRVNISPVGATIAVDSERTFRAIPKDRSNRLVEDGITFSWKLLDNEGSLQNETSEIVTYRAPSEPALVRLSVEVTQGDVTCTAEVLITVTASLPDTSPETKEQTKQGLPAYTFQRAVGELWRSRYEVDKNIIVVNSGHRDFVFSSRSRALKLRYLTRLFSKELVLNNFPGLSSEQLLERFIELTTYTEERLR